MPPLYKTDDTTLTMVKVRPIGIKETQKAIGRIEIPDALAIASDLVTGILETATNTTTMIQYAIIAIVTTHGGVRENGVKAT